MFDINSLRLKGLRLKPDDTSSLAVKTCLMISSSAKLLSLSPVLPSTVVCLASSLSLPCHNTSSAVNPARAIFRLHSGLSLTLPSPSHAYLPSPTMKLQTKCVCMCSSIIHGTIFPVLYIVGLSQNIRVVNCAIPTKHVLQRAQLTVIHPCSCWVMPVPVL